ncbi:MAG: S9 family peptidase [Opitutae bacterium]|nr:S9 family peptidase [Opitutae bacterium]
MPRLPLLRLALVTSLFVLAALPRLAVATDAPAAAKDSPLIQATDLLKLKQLSSPALSPDGKWVVYVVNSIEPKPDAKDDWVYHTHLWLAATDGSAPPRQLTHSAHSNTAPAWSPDGTRIAFVRGGSAPTDKAQIYTLALAGGEAVQLTKSEFGAGNPRWSPDGSKILFTTALSYAQVRDALEKSGADPKPKWSFEKPGRTANDTGNWGLKNGDKAKSEDKDAKKPAASPDGSLQERREWLAKNEADGNPRPLDRLAFLNEFDINPNLTFSHVFVQEAREDAPATDLTPGYNGFAAAEWMADGKSIVCAGAKKLDEHPDRSTAFSLYQVDAAGGGVKPFAALADYSLGNATPSPDGKWVALTATPGEAFGYGQTVVAIVPAAGGVEPKLLTEKLDRSAGNLQWSADNRFIYFVAATDGGFPLYRVPAAGGTVEKLTDKAELGVRDYALGREVLVQVLTSPANPYELHAGPVGARDSHPLTAHNSAWIAGKKLSAITPHSLVNKEGLTIQYWTMPPTEFDAKKKYPLLVEIHGGPAAMWGPGEDSMWFEFQYFAARGYAIVFSNPRGSGGYGYDFQHANHKDWGIGPAGDILSAADFVAKESYIDKARQVVTGGSYGGYMVAWLVGHDQRFKAAVAQRGVYHLPTFFGEANAWRLVPIAFGGYPWQEETRRILERDSPFNYVEAIKTPLLIQHGDNDRRTGFGQSEMLLKALKVLGRDVESVRYPRATHEMSRSGEPKQRLDSLVRYEEFFRRYIGEN